MELYIGEKLKKIDNITKLNLGAGKNILKGYVNLDIIQGGDVVHNLEIIPYPFKDNTFDEVVIFHVLEHIENQIGLFNELNRICKNNAVIKIVVPYFASPSYYIDPSHRCKFCYQTLEAYTQNSNYPYKLNYIIVKRRLTYLSCKGFMKSKSKLIDFIINLNPVMYQRFFCYILPCSELHIEMLVVK